MTTAADNYNAQSIRILPPEEVNERFEWHKIEELAQQYQRSPKWIERGFEACWRSGVDKDYFIDRYLKKDQSIALNPIVAEAFRDLLLEQAGETK